ncbi:16S rRNA (guanine(966)-N(2))-methyltransferase RsmD [Conchiformibius steedae DSM 2580]|uniref:16S rRNA (Guanine(966)-N(2))-methyltransferase RsmD n=2 Tax=Conchiformibius steedae TaxID=153493 RepID=A0AAE9HU99_9NEIS|nr:16S rRNA (guanine(966)-N(2))-methyltransferase RsmD [Conchiformibius steedae]QMT34027.1 16S rRNA (guanine(966)-N(2))-methyltransferase RsmD [Conchiformibius steedae]URD66798.1 16S rRNA (guanine(966)-N(2))-methyltransferase RsmD [Conchiformibius steedae DSM 2580]
MNKKHAKHSNQVRISGGIHRGRKLSFADAEGLRPTPESVRQKLFNWLGQELYGQSVLDLFAGSGALGLEAASRHAARVCLCEKSRPSAQTLQSHIRTLNLTATVQVVCADALAFLAQTGETFDIVLLDPPFAWQQWDGLWTLLRPRLANGARVYIEAGMLPDLPDWLVLRREGRAGQSRFGLWEYVGD